MKTGNICQLIFQTDAMFETWLMKTRNIYLNDKLDIPHTFKYEWNNHTILVM
jgi:hypothetical protein